MPTDKNTPDLFKLTINLIIIGLLIITTYRIVAPFLLGFFWAVMVVIATWPLMKIIQSKLRCKRIFAVLTMSGIIALVLLIPLIIIISSISQNSSYFINSATNLSHQQLPSLNWLTNLPLLGENLHEKWLVLIKNDGAMLIKEIQPYIGQVTSWLLTQLANISILLVHAVIMIIFSALLYLKGEMIASYTKRLSYRLSRQKGLLALTLAEQTIRAVALGIVVTALIQAIIGGLALALTNIAYAGLLTLIIFILCVAQLGPLFVLIPSIIWQFWDGNTVSGVILIIVATVLTTLDSVMRAMFIKKGADLPFILILFGVIGGLLAFGMLGLFIGPVTLALAYKLMNAWINEEQFKNLES